MKKVPFTQDGFNKLKSEYDELVKNKKEKAIDRLQKARNMGDLSENSEYTAAKEDLAFVEGRVRELEEIMKNAEIIEQRGKSNIVDLGAHIVIDMNGKNEEFTIVGEFEANPMEKKLSSTSPIGKAVMGKKKGDTFSVTVPAGKMVYTILEIKEV